MYIATCAFDKTISIFDFFSGELVTQVSGHSELVTGVKFSPDGRYLVSIGGDGCILMWRVAEFLVKAMQDRLIELMSSAQRRNHKATAAVRKSYAGAGGGGDVPPPPLPAPSFGPDGLTLPPQQQLMPPLPPPHGGDMAVAAAAVVSVSAVAVTSSSSSSSSSVVALAASIESTSSNKTAASGVSAQHKNQWAARLDQQQGYELFGKKIIPNAAANRNKFTLELTATTRGGVLGALGGGAGTEGEGEGEAEGEGHPTTSGPSDGNLDGSTRLVDALEAGDDVMISALSDTGGDDDDDDDDDDGAHLFKPSLAPDSATTPGHSSTVKSTGSAATDEYDSDFEDPTNDSAAAGMLSPTSAGDAEAEPDLAKTQHNIEGLAKSAKDLEGWLENMVRSLLLAVGEGSSMHCQFLLFSIHMV
jgi:WD40 repeat protein